MSTVEILLTISSGVAILFVGLYFQQLAQIHSLRQDCKSAIDELAQAKKKISHYGQQHTETVETLKSDYKREAEKKEQYIAGLRRKLHTCMIIFRQHKNQIGAEPKGLFDDALP